MARRPTELRFKEHHDSLCKGGRGLPASGTTSPGAVTGKPPSLALTAPSNKAPGLHPYAGASGEPRRRPVKLREGQTPETRNAETPPPPSQVPAELSTAADAPTAGPPKHATPASPANLPLRRDKGEAGEESAARDTQERPQPELGTWDRGTTVTPKARLRCPPTPDWVPLTDAEPRRRRRPAGSRLPRDHRDAGVRGPRVRWDPPTSLGCGRRR